MFNLFGGRRSSNLEARSVTMQGEIVALHLLVGCLAALLDERQTKLLAAALKGFLGKNYEAQAKGITEEYKQTYNNSVSASIFTLAQMIEASQSN